MGGFRLRLTLVVLGAILPAIVLALTGYLQRRDLAIEDAAENAQRLAQLVAAQERAVGEGAHQTLRTLAHLSELRQGDFAACERLFRELMGSSGPYANLGIVTPAGDIVCSAVPLKGPVNVADRAYFQRAIRTRGFAVGDWQVGRVTGKPTINMARPVLDSSGELRYVVYVAIDLEWLSGFAAQAKMPPDSVVQVFDRQGRIMARHPDAERWIGFDGSPAPIFKALKEGSGNGSAAVEGLDGVIRVYGFAPLGDDPASPSGWSVVGVSRDEIVSTEGRVLARSLAWLGAVTFLVLLLAWAGSGALLMKSVRSLQQLADSDALTGVNNRRRFLELGEREHARAVRLKQPLAAVLLDIDRFKKINDSLGHAAGDQVLVAVAGRIQSVLRDIDFFGRYGGEEFAILLVGVEAEEAARVAERIREGIGARPVDTAAGPVPVTASLGVALLGREAESLAALLGRADAAMYSAKQAGRNRVARG